MNPVIWEIVRDLTAECFDTPASNILPATHFYDDLDSSLHIAELIMDVEERFGIRVDDETWGAVLTVGDMTTVVEQCVGSEWPSQSSTVWPPAPRISE